MVAMSQLVTGVGKRDACYSRGWIDPHGVVVIVVKEGTFYYF